MANGLFKCILGPPIGFSALNGSVGTDLCKISLFGIFLLYFNIICSFSPLKQHLCNQPGMKRLFIINWSAYSVPVSPDGNARGDCYSDSMPCHFSKMINKSWCFLYYTNNFIRVSFLFLFINFVFYQREGKKKSCCQIIPLPQMMSEMQLHHTARH